MELDHPQPIVVPPGSGETLKFLGVTHKLTHGQTGGAYYLFELEFDPESGNRLHVHQHEDEMKLSMCWKAQSRSGWGTKSYKQPRVA